MNEEMAMERLIEEMLSKKVWAVVGATDNATKFGYKIYTKLKRFGYEVYAINPMYQTVDGDVCYPDLKSVGKEIDCVNIVVGPERAQKALEAVNEMGIKNIWFQPGTFTPEIIDRSEVLGLNTVYYNCVLVELDKK